MQKKYRIIFVMANGKEIKIYRSSESKESALEEFGEKREYYEYRESERLIRIFRENICWMEIKELEGDEL